jgi:putative oxidoreductase
MLKSTAILVARVIFGAVFLMAVTFKVMDINATAGFIAAAGFPMSLILAYLAALFEALLVIAFFSGAFLTEAALLAAIYVIFLAFAFHGPSHWSGNQTEFGFFIDHFTFFAGLLLAAAMGPGERLALKWSLIGNRRDL